MGEVLLPRDTWKPSLKAYSTSFLLKRGPQQLERHSGCVVTSDGRWGGEDGEQVQGSGCPILLRDPAEAQERAAAGATWVLPRARRTDSRDSTAHLPPCRPLCSGPFLCSSRPGHWLRLHFKTHFGCNGLPCWRHSYFADPVPN